MQERDKRNDRNVFYLIDYIIKTINLPDFIEGETNQILKGKDTSMSATCCCPFPDHSDRNASFHIKKMNNEVWIFHCLAGETKVLTWEGNIPIKDLAGTTQKILTQSGFWVEAPFFNFGRQKLFKINLTRNGLKKTIRATAEHRWFYRSGSSKKEKTTNKLKSGDRLSWSFPKSRIKQIGGISPQGISHGIVFGDGAKFNEMSCVDLWGDKNLQLLKWFGQNRTLEIKCPSGLGGKKVLDLPLYYKQRPSLDESPSYLIGWLAGWLAADGHVAKDGTTSLNSAKKENLEFARLVATRVGIGTYGITCQNRVGLNKDGEASDIFRVHFITEDLIKEFFLIEEHRNRFENSDKKWMRRAWVVESVEEDVEEDVYCALVENTHSFTLEDNILTGNCFGCGKKGNIIHFCMDFFGLRNKYEAILFLCKKFNIKNKEDLILAGIKNISKKVDVQRKMESSNIIASNQCRMLLRKDFEGNKKWVSEAYKRLNEALDSEDEEGIERVGYEACNKMMEN